MKRSKTQNKKFNIRKERSKHLAPSSISFAKIKGSVWILPLIALGILIILFTIREISNYDIGFHLAAGRWIIENFSFPYKDIFTYTVSQNEYIDIQWLYQVLMFSLYNFFDYYGLMLFNSLSIFLVFFFMLRRMNLYGISIFISLLLLLVTAITIQLRFSYRPEIITWVFILFVLFILDRYFYLRNDNLFWLPVIMLFWINMHGLFIIGFILMGAYLISIYFQKKKADRNLLKWMGISAIAVFINPYFIEGVLFPFYLFTRLQSGSIFRETITELQSPLNFIGLLDLEIYLYFVSGVISFFLLFVTFRKRSLHEFILLSAFFYISFSSFRNIPIFIIYAIHIIGICISDLIKSKPFNELILKLRPREKIIAILFSAILILISMRIISNAYYWSYNSGIKFGTGIDETMLPEQSADFLIDDKFKGRMINKLEFGGWLAWKTKQPVFIDGRLEVIKEDFYKEYYSSFSGNGLNSLINRYEPEIIINDISTFSWTDQMNKLPDWRLIHWDEAAAIYSKDHNNDFNFMKGLEYAGIDTNITGEEINEILERGYIAGFTDWLNGFVSTRQRPVQMIKMGNFSFDNGQLKAAELLYLSYIKKCSGEMDEINYSDVYYNLGSVYYLMKDNLRAEFCYEKYLLQKPYDTSIRNRVNELKGRQ